MEKTAKVVMDYLVHRQLTKEMVAKRTAEAKAKGCLFIDTEDEYFGDSEWYDWRDTDRPSGFLTLDDAQKTCTRIQKAPNNVDYDFSVVKRTVTTVIEPA